jgi:outer membrane protein assembly factor BamD (BamD/ComL family)
LCKIIQSAGGEYDGRKLAEARQLIDVAMKNYPELNKDDAAKKRMVDHLYAVTAGQADKDMKRAEWYERTKHPGSAYYIYELVRRNYPNTKYAEEAERRMKRLDLAKEREQKRPKGGAFDGMRQRWNRLWGLDDDEGAGNMPAGSPQALPASVAPGRPQ